MTAHEAQLESALEALARLALEQDSRIRDAVAEALEQMVAALGDVQARHAEQYEALRKERDEARAEASEAQRVWREKQWALQRRLDVATHLVRGLHDTCDGVIDWRGGAHRLARQSLDEARAFLAKVTP